MGGQKQTSPTTNKAPTACGQGLTEACFRPQPVIPRKVARQQSFPPFHRLGRHSRRTTSHPQTTRTCQPPGFIVAKAHLPGRQVQVEDRITGHAAAVRCSGWLADRLESDTLATPFLKILLAPTEP